MAYEVKQGNIFGRLGTGIGKGLADQVPKEIDRHRLSSGLKDFENESGNLTPLQQYTRLAAIPGITPQMLQTLPEILKQQNVRNYYANKGQRNQSGFQEKPFSSLDEAQFAGKQNQKTQQAPQNQREIVPADQEPYGQPQIQENNPLRPSAIPKGPWTPERRDQDISQILEDFPGITIDEARNISSDNERRDLAQPEAEQLKDKYLDEQQKKADEKVFNSVSGENIEAFKRGVARELRTNPNATVKEVVNKWTNRALDVAKTKTQLDALANRSMLDTYNPLKKQQTLDKLNTYQKIFHESGNSEEYFNILKTDFSLSPWGAASIAYPRSKKVQEEIKNVKSSNNPTQMFANSRKYASDIEKHLTSDDSLLAIARDLRIKDPYFDQSEFFNQLRSDRDTLRLTPRQERELSEGESDFLPTWGDLWIFPFTRGIQ